MDKQYHGLALREVRKACENGLRRAGYGDELAAAVAKEMYPAPKVQRPRVVTKASTVMRSTFQCRLVKGRFLYAYHEGNEPVHDFVEEITEFFDGKKLGEQRPALFGDLPLFLDAYAELKANPTEFVDDE